MELEEAEEATITVNVGGFTFNECRMAKNSIIHTPVPKRFGSMNHNLDDEVFEEDDETFFAKFAKTPTLPTPMAMRDLSKRAQEALASLYISDETNRVEEKSPELKPKALFQTNSDDYDIN
jgi:hypothetical protein